MYRHFFTARQLVGVPVHLGSGNRVSVPTSITGSRRFLATATLAAVLVVAAEATFLFTAGPAGAVAIHRTQASAVSPMAVGEGHELTAGGCCWAVAPGTPIGDATTQHDRPRGRTYVRLAATQASMASRTVSVTVCWGTKPSSALALSMENRGARPMCSIV